MSSARFAVLGLGHARAEWFPEVARWSTTGHLPLDFVKCVSVEDLRARAEADFSAPGTATGRVAAYLRREREALRGCPVGRLTQDPEVMADPDLRRPVEETFGWLRARLAGLLEEGRAHRELAASLDPQAVAATLVAVLQGGYVLARASGSADTYRQAVDGALGLLACHAGEEHRE